MFMGPMQIEIWGTYLRAVLNWQCRWRNVRIYKRNKFRPKKKTQNCNQPFGGFRNVGDLCMCTVSEASHLSGWALLFMSEHNVSPYWLPIPDRGPHTHTHRAPQSVWTRRPRAKTPPSLAIKARFPDVSTYSLVSIPTESLVSFPSLHLLKTI